MERRDAGEVQEVAPGVRGLIAPNPGPMTHWGTNTFIVGEREVAIIDPGPDDPAHHAAIKAALHGAKVSHIIVTHAHLDHSPLARRFERETGAPVLAFGTADAGRSPIMQALDAADMAGGGEGVDNAFTPSNTLSDGDRVEGEDWHLDVLHTPGHFAGHLSFRWNEIVFSGDHVMDWSSSLVSPPDGDLTAFMATSRRLAELEGVKFLPSHGGALIDPGERLRWLIQHRENREHAILNAFGSQPQSIPNIAKAVYTDIPTQMLPAAERNVFAHLIDLERRNFVVAEPRLGLDARYRLA